MLINSVINLYINSFVLFVDYLPFLLVTMYVKIVFQIALTSDYNIPAVPVKDFTSSF